ncbi:macrophomate synthase [Stemphylium lycopersici]|nr:macrophomate synthase [Stemphylium lycopersici]
MSSFTPYSEQPSLHTKAPYRASMLTQPANLRQALKDAQADSSKSLMGVAHGIPSTFVTKLIASTKPDFIWIDVEHGMFNRLTLHDCIHAAQHHSEGKSMVICRVPKHDELSLTTALDAGCAGIVIPHVESAQEVKDFMKEMYFGAGKGHRSFSPWTFTPGLTTSLYSKDPYNVATANNHICLIPQIESLKGVENAEEIAAVEGISGLMFGPGDYMIEAGMNLDDFLNGKPDPNGVLGLDQIPMAIQSGMRAIAVQFDVWGLTRLIANSLEEGWKHAKTFEGNPKPSMTNGAKKDGQISPTSSVPSPSFTTTTTPTGGPSPTSTGLPPGAIAGISIGAIAGVLIIALVGFLLGRRRGSKRRPSTNDHAAVLGVEGPVREYKGGKDGQNRSLADREGRGVARWWGKKFDKNVDAKGTTEAGQQGKGSNVVVHKTGVAIDDLPEFRSNGRLLLGTAEFTVLQGDNLLIEKAGSWMMSSTDFSSSDSSSSFDNARDDAQDTFNIFRKAATRYALQIWTANIRPADAWAAVAGKTGGGSRRVGIQDRHGITWFQPIPGNERAQRKHSSPKRSGGGGAREVRSAGNATELQATPATGDAGRRAMMRLLWLFCNTIQSATNSEPSIHLPESIDTMLFNVQTLALAALVSTLVNGRPLGSTGPRNIVPRSKSYAVVNVGGDSTTETLSTTTSIVETTKTVEVVGPGETVTEEVTATVVKPQPAPAPTSCSSSSSASKSSSSSSSSTPSPVSSTPRPTSSSTSSSSVSSTTPSATPTITSAPADSTPTPIETPKPIFITVTVSESAGSKEYYDDGMWHTYYEIKTFEAAAAVAATPSPAA